MALNFPNSPSVDDTFTDGTTTWQWDGTSWNVVAGAGISAEAPDVFKTFTADSGTTTADAEDDSFAIVGGTDITTAISGDQVTINFTGSVATPDQNLFQTFNADAGTITASSPTDSLTVAGAGTVSTAISGNTLTITGAGAANLGIDDLTDVDTSSNLPSAGNVLKWDGAKWSPGADLTAGGGGNDVTSVVAPFAFARIDAGNLTTPTQFVEMQSAAHVYNANTDSYIDFTFDTAQSNTNYVVVTDLEIAGDANISVEIANKTVNGFRANFYDDTTGTELTPGSVGANVPVFMVYNSNFTVDVSVGANADTLDGFEGVYFLNYNNFINTPTIPSDVSDLTDTTSLLFDKQFSSLTNTPTTIAGYGITDAFDGAFSSLSGKPTTIAGYGITDAFDGAFSSLSGTPTTIAGYGITDALSTSSNIGDLNNVSSAAPSTGQALVWDGSTWGPDTVSGGGGDPDQNLWLTFNGDAGSVSANTTTDTFTFTGGTNISTTVTGDSVRIDMPAALGVSKYDDLEEVVRTGRTIDKSYMPAFAMLRLNNAGNSAYLCDSHGYTGNNPTLYAIGGMTIAFDLDQIAGHPFEIQDGTGTAYNTGLIHVDIIGNVSTGANAQGKDGGTLYWEVPETISGNYRYQCTLHPAMVGAITIKRISVI